jgi:hypothetical protein
MQCLRRSRAARVFILYNGRMTKAIILAVLAFIVIVFLNSILIARPLITEPVALDSTPKIATLSGTYVCLPHLDTSGPQTEECAFGLKTDEGVYYAVNFGASASAMEQFQSGAHVTAEGFIVIKEALSSNQWEKYNMKGIFTVTKILQATPANAL